MPDDIDTTFDAKFIDLCNIRVTGEQCTIPLEQTYNDSFIQSPGINGRINGLIYDAWLASAREQFSRLLEYYTWQGSTSTLYPGYPLDCFDGFLQLFEDNLSAPQKINGVVLTSSNIIAEINKVYFAISSDFLPTVEDGLPEVKIVVDPATYRILKVAAHAQLNNYNNAPNPSAPLTIQSNVLYIYDIPIFATFGLPANTMVAARTRDLWVGTDLLSDMAEISILDLRGTTHKRALSLDYAYRLGVNYWKDDYIVYYRETAFSATTANLDKIRLLP
jgi:hypothetical protein